MACKNSSSANTLIQRTELFPAWLGEYFLTVIAYGFRKMAVTMPVVFQPHKD